MVMLGVFEERGDRAVAYAGVGCFHNIILASINNIVSVNPGSKHHIFSLFCFLSLSSEPSPHFL